ncbi:MAG: YIP1 family protein [Thermoanaerobaculia bacterium]
MSAAPPPGSLGPGALPWERRAQIGIVQGYVESVKLFLSNPNDAWSRARESGGFEDPLLFGILSAVVGSVFRAIYGLMFAPIWIRLVPLAFRHRWMGRWPHGMAGPTGCAVILWPIATAIGVTIGLFIASGIFHLCLMLVGGLNNSTSGFEGTFRAVSYSSVSMLANIVPIVGGLISLIWGYFLNVKGAMRMHRTTSGKANAALLIPLALVILLLMAVLAVVVGLIVAARSKGSL